MSQTRMSWSNVGSISIWPFDVLLPLGLLRLRGTHFQRGIAFMATKSHHRRLFLPLVRSWPCVQLRSWGLWIIALGIKRISNWTIRSWPTHLFMGTWLSHNSWSRFLPRQVHRCCHWFTIRFRARPAVFRFKTKTILPDRSLGRCYFRNWRINPTITLWSRYATNRLLVWTFAFKMSFQQPNDRPMSLGHLVEVR